MTDEELFLFFTVVVLMKYPNICSESVKNIAELADLTVKEHRKRFPEKREGKESE